MQEQSRCELYWSVCWCYQGNMLKEERDKVTESLLRTGGLCPHTSLWRSPNSPCDCMWRKHLWGVIKVIWGHKGGRGSLPLCLSLSAIYACASEERPCEDCSRERQTRKSPYKRNWILSDLDLNFLPPELEKEISVVKPPRTLAFHSGSLSRVKSIGISHELKWERGRLGTGSH